MNSNQFESAEVITKEITAEVNTREQVKDNLIGFICRQFLVDAEDIQIDKSLVDTGIIDSMGLIEISSYIEQTYNFRVTEDKMNRKYFGSVLLIVDFIESNIR